MQTLKVHQICKRYQTRTGILGAVRNVSLTIALGEVLAFFSPNGAGKTTTIKMIAGLIRPDAGWGQIAGGDPHRNRATLRQAGAVLEGNRNLYWRLTPEESLEYFGTLRGLSRRESQQRSRQLLACFALTDKRRMPVQKLSRGMQQKLAIAVALIHRPQLLLLDEPTLGLDVEATQNVKALVREIAAAGHGILLTTHQFDLAEELSDRVAIIQRGEILAQEPTRDLIRRFETSKSKTMLELFLAEFRRNWSQFCRYPLEAIGEIFVLTIVVYGLFLGARYVAGENFILGDRFEAIVIGYVLWPLVLSIMQTIASELQYEAQTGTLEQLFLSPFGAPRIFLTRAITSLLLQLIILLTILLILMLLTGARLSFPLSLLLPLLTTIMGAYGLAFIAGGLALLFKCIQQLLGILDFALLFVLAPCN